LQTEDKEKHERKGSGKIPDGNARPDREVLGYGVEQEVAEQITSYTEKAADAARQRAPDRNGLHARKLVVARVKAYECNVATSFKLTSPPAYTVCRSLLEVTFLITVTVTTRLTQL